MFSRYAFNAAHRAMALQSQGQASRSLIPATTIMTQSSQTTCSSYFYSSISATDVAERTKRLLDAKAQSGLTYDDLASKLGVTNTYAAQLLFGQAKLTKDTAAKLQEALPAASQDDIQEIQSNYPMRSFDEDILKEPNVYRTYDAITHYVEAIKSIINE